MSVGKDFSAIYSVVFKKTLKSYLKYIILVPMLILYASTYEASKVILNLTLGGLGAGGGLIAGISSWFIMSFILSDYLGHLNALLFNKKIKFSDIGSHRMTYFSSVLSATAIPNIVMYIIARLLNFPIPLFVLMIFYMLYAVPEVIYQKDKDRTDIFIYGHSFIKENWHLWGVINLVFIVLYSFANVFLVNNLIGPIYFNIVNVDNYQAIGYLVYKILWWSVYSMPLVFFFIFRGYLFKVLSVSSRRKREYMRNIYGE